MIVAQDPFNLRFLYLASAVVNPLGERHPDGNMNSGRDALLSREYEHPYKSRVTLRNIGSGSRKRR